MGIQTSIVAEAETWQETNAAVHGWRGRCLSILARGEVAVSETLLALSGVAARGDTVALPHLIGQRMQALADAIAVDGPFHVEGKRLAPALEAFRSHAALRTFLCHAPGTIARDQAGRWLLVLETLALRARRGERSTCVVREAESATILKQLTADCQRMVARLGIFNETILAPLPKAPSEAHRFDGANRRQRVLDNLPD